LFFPCCSSWEEQVIIDEMMLMSAAAWEEQVIIDEMMLMSAAAWATSSHQ
jgi:hypothetical protein